ncbi:MAG: GNAT family N-acetyltransferase [Paracoccaceae bacterium]
MMQAPLLITPRLRLRAHVLSDMDPFWRFYQSDRAVYMSAPQNRTHLFYGLHSEIASWQTMGHGGWAVDTADGQMVGQVSITHPPHFAETEIGWLVFDGYEGQGYAYEAAQAALKWAWANLPHSSLVSYIHRDNARSQALALRLGAAADPKAPCGASDIVYRHSRPKGAMA